MAGAPPTSDEKLMLYLDGELARDEARDVERALEASPDARIKADALAQLRDVLQARVSVAQDEAAARLEGMWERLRPELKPAPQQGRRRLWDAARDWFG